MAASGATSATRQNKSHSATSCGHKKYLSRELLEQRLHPPPRCFRQQFVYAFLRSAAVSVAAQTKAGRGGGTGLSRLLFEEVTELRQPGRVARPHTVTIQRPRTTSAGRLRQGGTVDRRLPAYSHSPGSAIGRLPAGPGPVQAGPLHVAQVDADFYDRQRPRRPPAGICLGNVADEGLNDGRPACWRLPSVASWSGLRYWPELHRDVAAAGSARKAAGPARQLYPPYARSWY